MPANVFEQKRRPIDRSSGCYKSEYIFHRDAVRFCDAAAVMITSVNASPPVRRQQDGGGHRHDHQPADVQRGVRREGEALLHLCGDRPEAVDGRADRQAPGGCRRDEVHDHRERDGVGRRPAPVPRPLLGLRHGRVLPRQRPTRAHHLRRSVETGAWSTIAKPTLSVVRRLVTVVEARITLGNVTPVEVEVMINNCK